MKNVLYYANVFLINLFIDKCKLKYCCLNEVGGDSEINCLIYYSIGNNYNYQNK